MNVATLRTAQSDVFSFGAFRLYPTARAFEKNGEPLALGNRALDILIALVERAGEVVSHKDLISRAWRGLIVDPGNLRVHISGLRKALGDVDGKPRYIANVSGQGYCFLAPVIRGMSTGLPARAPEYPCRSARERLVLPPMLPRMVGREEAVRSIAADLIADRFVTIIGPGGMGKTTVAVYVAHAMLEEFADAVCFVDVSGVAEAKLVAATIASTLGLTIQTEDVVPTLLECLRTLRILLVLDNCEHVIDATATLAELIFKEAVGVHILTTSREALRVEGEHVYWLPPLESPAPDSSLKAEEVMRFPAVKVFMERAAASGHHFDLSDLDAPLVAGICGRLDGIALAIEIAAGRIGSHGIMGTVDLLEKGLGLHWQGLRTAHPRHQTIHALLDWSYCSLGELEQVLFRRLATFVGSFTVDAAQAVACDRSLDVAQAVDALDGLIAKSLVSTVVLDGRMPRYRLLETARLFASKILEKSGEAQAVALRHAQYFAGFLEEICHGSLDFSQDDGPPSLSEHLGNARAALAWCFADSTPNGRDPERSVLGLDLAAASAPLFLELSLLNECYAWSTKALATIDDATRGSRREMVLQEARAISSTWTRGNGDDVGATIQRGIEIAQSRGEKAHLLRLLVGMHIFLMRIGDFRASRAVAEELAVVARNNSDESYKIISDWMHGSSEHFLGNQAAAQRHYQTGFARAGPRNVQLFGLDYRVRALVTFARVLWLSGFPDRAAETARAAVDEAARMSKPLNVCFSLLYTAPVFLWCGDYSAAQDLLDNVMAHPNWRALPSLNSAGLALKGEVLLGLGEPEEALTLLRPALKAMKADRQNILCTRAACSMAEGLARAGQTSEALSLIRRTIEEVAQGEEPLELPELLRLKADILLRMPKPDDSEVESCLLESMTCARRQSARSWELRTALTLARFHAQRERMEQARRMLSPLFEQFTEGFETRDLKAATHLLDQLN